VPIWSLTGECYPIDFNGIDIEWYAGRGVYQLTVTGMKPITGARPIGARWSSAA
jgi:hypothetical protein